MNKIKSIEKYKPLQEHLNHLITSTNAINQQIQQYQSNYNRYKSVLTNQSQKQHQTQTTEDKINQLENYLDQFDDLSKRNELTITSIQQYIETLQTIKQELTEYVDQSITDKTTYLHIKQSIVKELTTLYNHQMQEEMKTTPEKSIEIQKKYSDITERFSDFLPSRNDQQIREYLSESEIEQLEKWTKKKMNKIVYDANKDGWSIKNCKLNEKIIGKKQLIFLIKDKDGEKFGCYFNPTITSPTSCNYGDNHCFEFNLVCTKNRLKQPTMFKAKKSSTINCFLCEQKEEKLVEIGDIWMYKKDSWEDCCIVESENIINYQRQEYALCGKAIIEFDEEPDDYNTFKPVQFIVIEMI